MAVASAIALQPVADVKARLQALLEHARNVKTEITVDPPLPVQEFTSGIDALHSEVFKHHDQTYRFATVETAARELFYSSISSMEITEPGFVNVWNLLDIVLLAGDLFKCTPELVCWLIEELLDSQTTEGCRIVFDYLESRRERLVQKDFHKKNLVFLRSCNELLRRLSRAEDAIFCGRTFFFLFQTFPLGDKSSVNLRGEFHVENTTKFEVADTQKQTSDDKMQVDAASTPAEFDPFKPATPQPSGKGGSKNAPSKSASRGAEEELLSNGELYPIFWQLQQDFSDPMRLFTPEHFQSFKKSLSRTIAKFKKTPTVVQTRIASDSKRDLKRKRGDGAEAENGADAEDDFVDKYNPKYLTSRDLFDLELSDLAFQRHILVQALILIDFLISLTEKSKKKMASLEPSNKSLLYSFTLSSEDAKWVLTTRTTIASYLSMPEAHGKHFMRMVDTVLARDKNWVRWKMESCPLIVRDPVSMDFERDARKGAKDATKSRRVPSKPMGGMDMSFLEERSGEGLEALSDPSRFTIRSIDELIDGIKTDELDLEMAMDDGEKTSLENAISNKRWRALRQGTATRLDVLDKVEPHSDLDAVFRPPSQPEAPAESEADAEIEANNKAAPTTEGKSEGNDGPDPKARREDEPSNEMESWPDRTEADPRAELNDETHAPLGEDQGNNTTAASKAETVVTNNELADAKEASRQTSHRDE